MDEITGCAEKGCTDLVDIARPVHVNQQISVGVVLDQWGGLPLIYL
jgi:hypothetical protein